MKLLTLISLGLLTTSTIFAQTTMCFKENHKSMSTIESTALDGGLCSSSKSLKEMKKDGWAVDDIKIESTSKGKNYIYIFKKDEVLLSTLNEEELEERIMQKIEKRKEVAGLERIVKAKRKMSKKGKDIYINKCQTCHGEKAEKTPYNNSRPLINLDLNDFQQAIRDYTVDEYDRGSAIVMKPYANMMNKTRNKEVYLYIQSLKPEEKLPMKNEENK